MSREKIYEFIKGNAWALWLGMGTSLISDLGLYDWQWWKFAIPMFILIIWTKSKKDE